MSYKLIRELNNYEQNDDIPASDYLIAASNPDGTPAEQTYRMTVKQIVSEYNREVAAEQAARAAAGDSVLGSTFSEVELIDGNEVIVDATPITAANIDTLVDPGSGLEVIEICYDAAQTVVPCTINGSPNPAVKYKQKKLSFAKSASSKYLSLFLSNTGVDYKENRSLFKINENGVVSQNFNSLKAAFDFVNEQVVSTSITINMFVQTDLDEPWGYGNGYMTAIKFFKINVFGANQEDLNLKKINFKHGVGITYVNPSAVPADDLAEMNNQWNGMRQFRHGQYRARSTAANPNPTDQATLPSGVILTVHPCVPLWINSDIHWRGIHFTMELHGDSIFALYRQAAATNVDFAQCKFSVKSYTKPTITAGIPSDSADLASVKNMFDIRDGSTMNVLNINDGTTFQDFSGRAWKNIDTSGLELDFSEVNHIEVMFLVEDGSQLKIIEYSSWAHAVAGQADRTMPARMTITSAIPSCTYWFYMTNASSVVANAPIILSNAVPTSDINVEYALKAIGFNTIRMWRYTDEDGVAKDALIPGADFKPTTTIEDVDYRNSHDTQNAISSLDTYDPYYDNHTSWTVY